MKRPNSEPDLAAASSAKPFEPLKLVFYRRILIASIFAHMGLLIQGVGSAWKMSEMASPAMVALVQTAVFLPTLLFAVPAGAVSDVFDQRKVQIIALSFSSASAAVLAVLAAKNGLTPWRLLALCACVGSGVTLFSPSLQASIREQVPKRILPQAIALNSAGFNIARSIGPAIGGMIIVGFGVVWTFGINSLFYIPMITVLFFWKYQSAHSDAKSEGLWKAMASGLSYVRTTPTAYSPIVRTFIFGALGSCVPALLPVFVRELLGGGANHYGLLLGAFGVGAVIGVLCLSSLQKFSRESVIGVIKLALAISVMGLSLSFNMVLAMASIFIIGAAWTMVATTFTTFLQMEAPSSLTGRVVSIFQAFFSGGVALGSLMWGLTASYIGTQQAFQLCAVLVALSLSLAFMLPLHVKSRDN